MLVRDVVMVVAGSGDEYNTKRKILTRKEVKCNACPPAEIGENIFSESKNW